MKNVATKIGLLAFLFSFQFFGSVTFAKPANASWMFNMTTESSTETKVQILSPFQIKFHDTGEIYSLKDVRVLKVVQIDSMNLEVQGEWGAKGQSQTVSIQLRLAESVQGYVWTVKPVLRWVSPAE